MHQTTTDGTPKRLYQAALETKRGGPSVAHIAYEGHTLCGAEGHTFSRGMSLEAAQTWDLAHPSNYCQDCKNAARDEHGTYREARAAYEYQRTRMLAGRPHLHARVTHLREALEAYHTDPAAARIAAENENAEYDAAAARYAITS